MINLKEKAIEQYVMEYPDCTIEEVSDVITELSYHLPRLERLLSYSLVERCGLNGIEKYAIYLVEDNGEVLNALRELL